jgi:hypothetical protein
VLVHAGPESVAVLADVADDVMRHLRPSSFPADRTRLLVEAIENHAPPEFVALLEGLQPFRTYRTRRDVSAALDAAAIAPGAAL